MPSVHLLNVSPGDCTIIQHASERVTMIDVCDGNIQEETRAIIAALNKASVRGNFAMCQYPTNPISYAKSIDINSIFRFILTHPDMDHLDGFAALSKAVPICNFWDTGARRPKPDFPTQGPYREADWDAFAAIRDGKTSTYTAIRQAGDRFSFANKNSDGETGGDGLYILAPDANLVKIGKTDDDINEGSYIICYNSAGGKIILPGDAHDVTWDYVFDKYPSYLSPCAFLLAPHHGRDSERSYEFLDRLKPKLTLIGCAPSQYIDYGQWNRRNLEFITSNQAGNVVLDIFSGGINVYIENDRFAEAKLGHPVQHWNSQSYAYIQTIR
jgi:competence protein ComEC